MDEANPRLKLFDVANHLRTLDEAAAYLSAALEENDPGAFRQALGDVARSRSMTVVAAATGLGRESLYKALSEDGNPSLDTVLRVMAALGLSLTVRTRDAESAAVDA